MAAAATRQHIVEAADRLFYERGFEATAFADIAAATGLSRGNFYYHFKAKDEILDAVITLRLERIRLLLAGWLAAADIPVERIRSFIAMLIGNRAEIMLYGCPVGTLCAELAKLDHIASSRASELFTLFREWLAGQFSLLGRAADADALAMHLLMRSQGVATLAAAFRDEAFIRREVEAMSLWLESLSPAAPLPPET
ncbi:MAG TPA: TetR family transcriptional regulator [Bosea sp. (in: a-proteobacteria)]|jgi:AcrR family transcriptional regulator|uniref:TetR/AcrR family transcriptional regulator n=1 Tax=Bosea sp. (in: a-proteobacteria) TaxID=1871050 RepID=UPI002E1096B4|nr:TetR family transcriptional regulator [Bosea sp. (in: a-proteobacteria)]